LDVGFDIPFSLSNGFGQQGDELMGALDTVKGASGIVIHGESPNCS
jgi:hypothetical protein